MMSGAATRATDPAAAETIAGLPPSTEVTKAMITAPKSPVRGSRPVTIAKAVASGISAREVTTPASSSVTPCRG